MGRTQAVECAAVCQDCSSIRECTWGTGKNSGSSRPFNTIGCKFERRVHFDLTQSIQTTIVQRSPPLSTVDQLGNGTRAPALSKTHLGSLRSPFLGRFSATSH